MLKQYENKVLSPGVRNSCPFCGGDDWRTVCRGQKQVQKYKVCKRCGYAKKISK